MDDFGAQLRRLRTLAGLSQEALAARAGLSRRGIADLERGARRSPYPDTARRLAAALGLRGVERDTFMASCRPSLVREVVRPRPSVPVEASPLIGRGEELAELTELLARTRLLTMTGAGGIGKTRLALAAARAAAAAYPDGVGVVDLTAVIDGAGVPAAAAATLGATTRRGEPVLDALREELRDRRLLLVLDNCEHVVDAAAALVDALLRAAPGLRILVTSREALRVPGETVWVTPPLRRTEAVELFVVRSGAGGASSGPDADQLRTMDAMCAQLDDLPLAIELAAVRVPALGMDQVAAHLTDRLTFLSRGHRVDPPRHRTLRAALDWSHALLSPSEQRLFARLAVFVDGWTVDAATCLGAVDGASETDLLDDLHALVDKSLVLAVDDAAGSRRLRFLETVRQYALGRLRATGEEDRLRARHAAYLSAFLERGSFVRLGVPYPDDPERVRREQGNLRAALHWLHESGRVTDGVAMCHALSGYWISQGHLREGADWYALFLAEPEAVDLPLRAAGLHAWGRLHQYAGLLDRADELSELSLAASIELDDPTAAARALCALGDVAIHRGSCQEAVDLLSQALGWAQRGGHDLERAQAMRGLGRATGLAGDREASRQWLRESLTILRRLGDPWEIAYVLQSLGEQSLESGQLEEAQTLLDEAYLLWQRAGTLMGARAALLDLTLVALRREDPGRAAEQLGGVLELSTAMHDSGSATTARAVEIAALVISALVIAAPLIEEQTGPTGAGAGGDGAGGGGAGGDGTGPDLLLVALRLVAFATAQRTAIGAPRPEAEQPEVDALVSTVRADVAARAEAAWTAGLGLSADRAVEEAAQTLAGMTDAAHGPVTEPYDG